MTPKKKGPRTLPLGASIHDAEYEARQRRAAWLNLYWAVGHYLGADTKERRLKAEDEMLRLHGRLEKLGVRSGHGVEADTPDGDAEDVQPA